MLSQMRKGLAPVEVLHQTLESQFHEIVTPTFGVTLPLEPNLYAFETTWNTIHEEKKLYLSLSPESALKKMIAAGIGNCYAISKSFRNLENSGKQHIPEFLMLEWYRTDATYTDIMEDTENLIIFLKTKIAGTGSAVAYQDKTLDIKTPWLRHSMKDLFERYAHLHLEECLKD